jgi:hypothetical protein
MLARFHNANHVHRLTQIHQYLSPNLKSRSFPATSDYNIKEKLSRAGSAYIPGYIRLQYQKQDFQSRIQLFPATSYCNIKNKTSRAGSNYSRLHHIAISKISFPEPDPIIPHYIRLQYPQKTLFQSWIGMKQTYEIHNRTEN